MERAVCDGSYEGGFFGNGHRLWIVYLINGVPLYFLIRKYVDLMGVDRWRLGFSFEWRGDNVRLAFNMHSTVMQKKKKGLGHSTHTHRLTPPRISTSAHACAQMHMHPSALDAGHLTNNSWHELGSFCFPLSLSRQVWWPTSTVAVSSKYPAPIPVPCFLSVLSGYPVRGILTLQVEIACLEPHFSSLSSKVTSILAGSSKPTLTPRSASACSNSHGQFLHATDLMRTEGPFAIALFVQQVALNLECHPRS
jgi:hypothetical protein